MSSFRFFFLSLTSLFPLFFSIILYLPLQSIWLLFSPHFLFIFSRLLVRLIHQSAIKLEDIFPITLSLLSFFFICFLPTYLSRFFCCCLFPLFIIDRHFFFTALRSFLTVVKNYKSGDYDRHSASVWLAPGNLEASHSSRKRPWQPPLQPALIIYLQEITLAANKVTIKLA